MQISVGSPNVSLAHIVRKEEGETPKIFGKAHTLTARIALSMLIYPLFARDMLPWGRILASETLWEHPWNLCIYWGWDGSPQLHMVTFFKGSIAFSGSYGNNNHLSTEESKQFKGTATGNGTYYHRGACWHCRCSLEGDRSQCWYRWMNCGKRTIAPSPHPSSQSSCLLLQWFGTWHTWQPGTQLRK